MSLISRAQKLQKTLTPHQAILLSRPADIRYFSDFICLNPEEREAFCVVTTKSVLLLYPSFSPVKKFSHITYTTGHWASDVEKALRKLVTEEKITETLVDSSSLFVDEYQQLQTITDLKLSALDRNTIWEIRIEKDAEELATLAEANHLTAVVMTKLYTYLKAGVTEQEIANECELLFKKHGSHQLAFPPVIAFGEHTALPHHQPTDTVLKKNMAVLFDIGGKINGYCGDMTRTWWFGDQPNQEFLKIEKIVKDAYEVGVKLVQAKCEGNAIDDAVRTFIDDAGYGKKFIHTTGHGVGLEIHEQPSLYFKKKSLLPKNAVVTIEPGIYLEGKFGYRFENTVMVTNKGYEVLTK